MEKIQLAMIQIASNAELQDYEYSDTNSSSRTTLKTNHVLTKRESDFIKSLETTGKTFQNIWNLLEEDVPNPFKLRSVLLKSYHKLKNV